MLNKETLTKFVKEANKGWNQFCVRMYTNNDFIKYERKLNLEIDNGLYGDDEAIQKSKKYKNFFNTIIPSLQHGRILSISRLTDPAFFKKNKDKPNLSIYYILELLNNKTIKEELKVILDEQEKFISSIKNIRNKILAHNSINIESRTIETGVESFFIKLNTIILKIKKEHPHLKDCNDLNLEYTEKLSMKGTKEIFKNLFNIKP